MIKKRHILIPIYFLLVLTLPGCDIIIGIFKAGFWSAIILIVILVALGWWGISEYRKRNM